MFKTVLFDIDGTLVDSNDAHARAWVRVLEEHGRRVEFERIRPLIGKGGDKLLREVTGIDSESDEGHAISARRAEIFTHEFLPQLQPAPGARRLIESLRDGNYTLGIATSAKADEVTGLLRLAGVDKLFDETTSSDDAERSKPDPDIVRAALVRSGARAIDAVMIGDTPYDIESGQRAGVGVIAFRCGGWWSDADLNGAIAIYDDPQDLLEHFDLSPFRRLLPVRG